MKKFLSVVAFTGLMAASSSAFAVGVGVGGSFGNACDVDESVKVDPDLSKMFTDDGYVKTDPKTGVVAKISCNAKAAITATSTRGAMKPGNPYTCDSIPDPVNFADCVQYKADVTWGAAPWDTNGIPTFTTPATITGTGKTTAAYAAQADITITPQTETRQMAPGSYNDDITVDIATY